jgi:hypothetical protein
MLPLLVSSPRIAAPQFPVTKESAMRPIGNPFSAAC